MSFENDNYKFTANIRDKDNRNYQNTPSFWTTETFKCYKKHLKVGTFERFFESNTFVYALCQEPIRPLQLEY